MGQGPMYQNPYGPGPMMPPGQMPGMRARPGRSRQGGGLLSKILGRGNSQQTGAAGLFSGGNTAARGAGTGGGILKTLSNPSSLNGFLTNTQKVLNTAQQFGPMIQQYGPLVRNLPSMWKLYRGLKDLPDADEETTKEETVQSGKKTDKKKKKPVQKKKDVSDSSIKPAQKQNNKGASNPKLFI
ncbi:YqfQ family protein [Mesobacillus jeotgali]|uniref:YqfQ family protein n=1 Tax=Mesobacillus jeotgali TaxID=129985 RepID=UPI0021475EF0|nr:YqfQ family protein [Mesobacillus jeotgali]